MIGKIKGTIDSKEGNYILVSTKTGVYYKLFIPALNLAKLKLNDQQEFYTYLHVRENELSLYGFIDKKQLQIFETLLSIPSIGPKSALNIIGFGSTDNLIKAVQKQDAEYFSQIPGIGKKTAQKILLDLANKFKVEYQMPKLNLTQDDQLVIEALVALGFQKKQALQILEKHELKGDLQAKITQALKLIK